MLTAADRLRLAALPRDEHGLRPQDPKEQEAHTAVLMAVARRRQDGYPMGLPPIKAGWAL